MYLQRKLKKVLFFNKINIDAQEGEIGIKKFVKTKSITDRSKAKWFRFIYDVRNTSHPTISKEKKSLKQLLEVHQSYI